MSVVPDQTAAWLTAFLDFPAPEFDAGVRFWRGATGYQLSAVRGEHGEFATLVPPDGHDYLRVQRLGEGFTRLHLDVCVPDPEEFRAQAVALGAAHAGATPGNLPVLRTPSGLMLCVQGPVAGAVPAGTTWPDGHTSRVVQVCLDVPRRSFDAEIEFWHRILGGRWVELEDAEIVIRQAGESALSLRLKPAEITPEVAAHLHLVTDQRATEVERLVGLGAVVRAVRPAKSILEAPGGLALCVVDEAGEGGTCRL